jgi:hypothetical protein
MASVEIPWSFTAARLDGQPIQSHSLVLGEGRHSIRLTLADSETFPDL